MRQQKSIFVILWRARHVEEHGVVAPSDELRAVLLVPAVEERDVLVRLGAGVPAAKAQHCGHFPTVARGNQEEPKLAHSLRQRLLKYLRLVFMPRRTLWLGLVRERIREEFLVLKGLKPLIFALSLQINLMLRACQISLVLGAPLSRVSVSLLQPRVGAESQTPRENRFDVVDGAIDVVRVRAGEDAHVLFLAPLARQQRPQLQLR